MAESNGKLPPGRVRVGLISDTHGLLRPEASAFLRGCGLILHAGDICDASVLDALGAIAPTIAVKGNNDRGPWASALRVAESVVVADVKIHIVHDIADLARGAEMDDVRVVVTGHSHRPTRLERGGVLFVNPGSAGPRRFRLPVSIGELLIEGGEVSCRLVDLAPSP